MDKFDKFLKDKVDDEKADFSIPESFDLKIEETLENLADNDKKTKLNLNKKNVATMVACFAFVFLVGAKYILPNNNKLSTMDENNNIARVADSPTQFVDEAVPESFRFRNSESMISDVNEIEALTIKSLKGESKYKFVNNKHDVSLIINLINSLNLTETSNQNINEWDFLIQTNGAINHSIMIKDNYINIDEIWFINNDNISDKIKELYLNINYEENDIKYCDINFN